MRATLFVTEQVDTVILIQKQWWVFQKQWWVTAKFMALDHTCAYSIDMMGDPQRPLTVDDVVALFKRTGTQVYEVRNEYRDVDDGMSQAVHMIIRVTGQETVDPSTVYLGGLEILFRSSYLRVVKRV